MEIFIVLHLAAAWVELGQDEFRYNVLVNQSFRILDSTSRVLAFLTLIFHMGGGY